MCNFSDGDVSKETGTSSCAICTHTHLPPFSSLGAERSGQPISSAARPRQGNQNLPLCIHYSNQDTVQCSFVLSRESFGITNDARFTNLFQPYFSFTTPVACHLRWWSPHMKTSFKAALLPAFRPLLTYKGRL